MKHPERQQAVQGCASRGSPAQSWRCLRICVQSNLCSCFSLSPRHSCLAITLAISALFFILLALFGPTAVQTLMNEGVRSHSAEI